MKLLACVCALALVFQWRGDPASADAPKPGLKVRPPIHDKAEDLRDHREDIRDHREDIRDKKEQIADKKKICAMPERISGMPSMTAGKRTSLRISAMRGKMFWMSAKIFSIKRSRSPTGRKIFATTGKTSAIIRRNTPFSDWMASFCRVMVRRRKALHFCL